MQQERREFRVWQASSLCVQWFLLNVMLQVSFLFVFHLFHVTSNKHTFSLSRSELLIAFPCISKLMEKVMGKNTPGCRKLF